MLQKPRLKTFVTVFPISESTWGVRGGSDELWRLRFPNGRAFEVFTALLPQLDGQCSTENIVERLGAKGFKQSEVHDVLEKLSESMLLEEADCEIPENERHAFESQISYFSRYTAAGGDKHQSKLLKSRVAVVGDGPLCRSLKRQLSEAGCGEIVSLAQNNVSASEDEPAGFNGFRPTLRTKQIDPDGFWPKSDGSESHPDLLIGGQRAEDPRLMEAIHEFSERTGTPWLLVRAMESQVGCVGPLFIPGETACYRSLDARLAANLPYFDEHHAFHDYLKKEMMVSATVGGLHAFFDLLSAAATIEVIKYLTGYAVPAVTGAFLTIDMATWDVECHHVLRVPKVGLQTSDAPLFAWKEMPIEALEGHGDNSIIKRRS